MLHMQASKPQDTPTHRDHGGQPRLAAAQGCQAATSAVAGRAVPCHCLRRLVLCSSCSAAALLGAALAAGAGGLRGMLGQRASLSLAERGGQAAPLLGRQGRQATHHLRLCLHLVGGKRLHAWSEGRGGEWMGQRGLQDPFTGKLAASSSPTQPTPHRLQLLHALGEGGTSSSAEGRARRGALLHACVGFCTARTAGAHRPVEACISSMLAPALKITTCAEKNCGMHEDVRGMNAQQCSSSVGWDTGGEAACGRPSMRHCTPMLPLHGDVTAVVSHHMPAPSEQLEGRFH